MHRKRVDPLNEYIDHIYYINLDKREDRRKEFENEMEKMGVRSDKVSRIPGVLNNDNGHKGCCASHIKALEAAIENNYKNVLICEDDFAFRKDKNINDLILNSAFNDIGEDYDVIMLVMNPCQLDDTEHKYIKRVKCASTAAGYIVNGRYYEKLLKLYKECHKNMQPKLINSKDEPWAHDQKWKQIQSTDKWYAIKPKIGMIRHGFSDIMQANYNFDL